MCRGNRDGKGARTSAQRGPNHSAWRKQKRLSLKILKPILIPYCLLWASLARSWFLPWGSWSGPFFPSSLGSCFFGQNAQGGDGRIRNHWKDMKSSGIILIFQSFQHVDSSLCQLMDLSYRTLFQENIISHISLSLPGPSQQASGVSILEHSQQMVV